MKAFILVFTSIFFAPVAIAQGELSALPKKIKVLSWNIYMLPGFLGQGKIPRAEAIGQLLASSEYDVIVFQEAFHQKARKKINRSLQPVFSFQAGPANRKLFSFKTNSGIWIFSRHPILATHSIIFQTRQGIDAMSRKGALMIDVNVDGSKVQIIGTHLQNGGGDWVRHSQCVELYHRLLKKHQQPGVPQIICGDFNINRKDTSNSYRFMIQTLDASDGDLNGENHFSYDRTNNDLHVESGSGRDLIDYILIRDNEGWVEGNKRNIRVFKHQWQTHHQDLSDHYAVEAEVRFQNTVGLYTVSVPEIK
jgi:endonuclease/exonuclease/phosphatase family metal-dependent hydrolase